jgi:hypothetical protein
MNGEGKINLFRAPYHGGNEKCILTFCPKTGSEENTLDVSEKTVRK